MNRTNKANVNQVKGKGYVCFFPVNFRHPLIKFSYHHAKGFEKIS